MLGLFYVMLVFLILFVVIYFFTSMVLNSLSDIGLSWGSSYECGFFSSVLNLNCFSYTYFFLLVLFVIFDLEISLLLNMPTQGLLFCNFFYYYFFLLILLFGYLVELLFGYVCWSY
uniref:NADH-ubiquinone oxidoreductase chain 3 n=1 Tax=Taenia martis TaxID=159981 RepID=L8B2Q3_9CEST|nr:NADH dehydrogenase subunit 3 [Taenia martis]BAM76216.1 NADH dehydrogenase subunit 3 [Taenia martis]